MTEDLLWQNKGTAGDNAIEQVMHIPYKYNARWCGHALPIWGIVSLLWQKRGTAGDTTIEQVL